MTRLETTESPGADKSVGTFEQRWRAWQQQGRARAVRSNRRLRLGLALLALAGALVWLVSVV